MANSARGSVTVKTNATKIQNVNVSPAPPNDGDTLVYNAAEAKYKPAPGGGGSVNILDVWLFN